MCCVWVRSAPWVRVKGARERGGGEVRFELRVRSSRQACGVPDRVVRELVVGGQSSVATHTELEGAGSLEHNLRERGRVEEEDEGGSVAVQAATQARCRWTALADLLLC